jgi:hypothetical protein
MSKLQVQMKFKGQMTKLKMKKVLALSHFDIHLAFACLREAPPAEASCGGQALRRRQEL